MNLIIKFILIVIILSLSWFLFVQVTSDSNSLLSEFTIDDNQDEKEDDESKVFIIDGYKAIQLDEEVIESSGIEYKQLDITSFKPELIVYAEVVDVTNMVISNTEYQNLLAEKKVLQNDLNNHDKILKRALALHKAKSLTTRDLEKTRAERDLKAFELNSFTTRQKSFEYKLQSSWGDTLKSLIIDPQNQTDFDQIASYKKSLILISLTKNQSLKDINQKVFVNNVNQRDSAIEIKYFDRANQVNNPLHGESYYYLADTGNFRTGMRLFGWIEEDGETISGQFIPDKTVVWYANEPWIYVKHNAGIFVRKPISAAKKIKDGWLLKDKTLIGDAPVVTSGGQTLLSEEFKWAIPDENDD